MKRIRITSCGNQLLAQPTSRRPSCLRSPAALQNSCTPHNHRIQSRLQTTAATSDNPFDSLEASATQRSQSSNTSSKPARYPNKQPLVTLPSPHPSAAQHSAKLAALRSRLSLPQRFPLQTLARTLIHPSADPNPAFNNGSLSILGGNLLGYYTTEYLLANYPRLPMAVVFAAQSAYTGPKALATIASEWGIEAAAEPGGEVDPGLLQFKRLRSGDDLPASLRNQRRYKWNVTTTNKVLESDEFGSATQSPSSQQLSTQQVPLEEAAQSFVRALIGSLHLHLGRPLVKRFFRDHFLSRHLDLSTLFDFRTPTRDLSRLCAREGFEAPVARLISETGRLSRHPVFVVGVYSGKDKLGEGAGSSLDEARVRAAAAALKGWYLYRPTEVTVPSSMEGETDQSKWKPNMVDCGEVIV
ncbi:ribonuclease III [Aaosphaeria arxii CBS 175.79]|uniref:Large ribosomal subunit protein mL44 n=1 Tax=Aaosphaeria arxii CBS 175.79 TaxID=1450172 RepID=A0A6A5XBX1_9PLEO|nr:ribonuclease III [Aaosphaeria arxii CBS 175.79]KAF2010403.1 ribonuclease III [Aaosphaeria arxii CBS 175.79]